MASKDDLQFSQQAKDLRSGIYEHYNGHRYQVLGPAFHSETLEEMVVYKELYGEGRLWARPLGMFLEEVEIDGKTRPRFEYLGEK